MVKWEYMTTEEYRSDEQLNALGEEGWELVSCDWHNGHIVNAAFKRPAAPKKGEEEDTPIEALRLSASTNERLKAGGFHTVQSLIDLPTLAHVLRVKNIGTTRYKEIAHALDDWWAKYGTD